jgi:hypothetical protein
MLASGKKTKVYETNKIIEGLTSPVLIVSEERQKMEIIENLGLKIKKVNNNTFYMEKGELLYKEYLCSLITDYFSEKSIFYGDEVLDLREYLNNFHRTFTNFSDFIKEENLLDFTKEEVSFLEELWLVLVRDIPKHAEVFQGRICDLDLHADQFLRVNNEIYLVDCFQ